MISLKATVNEAPEDRPAMHVLTSGTPSPLLEHSWGQTPL